MRLLSADRKREIMDKALRIISLEGIQNLTTKHLAEEVGVTEPALYRHYHNKSSIILAVLEDLEKEAFEAVGAARGFAAGALEKLGQLFIKRCESFAKEPHKAAVIFSEDIFRSDGSLLSKLSDVMKIYRNFIMEAITQGRQSGCIRSDIPAEHIALFIMGSLRLHVTRWRMAGGGFCLHEEAVRLWDSLALLIAVKPVIGKEKDR